MELEEYLDEWFEDETEEVGLYLAMARKAEEEGYPEIARQLTENAMEEAKHAAINAEIAGKIGTTEENLKKMVEGEDEAGKDRLEIAEQVEDEEIKSYLITTAKDEQRHNKALKGLIDRYF